MFKYLKWFFGKSKVVDTLNTLPKFLKEGTTLELAKPMHESPMVRVLQEQVMTTGNPKMQYRYFTTALMPNVSNKPWL